MKATNRSLPLLVAAGSFLSASVADAATLFVHGSNAACSDTIGYAQAQSETTPLCSIQAAANLVQPGDTANNAQYGFSLYNNGAGGITLSNNLAFGNGLGAVAATDAATMFTETAT